MSERVSEQEILKQLMRKNFGNQNVVNAFYNLIQEDASIQGFKELLQQEREPIAQDMKKCPNFGDGAVLGFIDKLLEKLSK